MTANELMIGDWVSVLAHFLETSTEGTATSGGYNLCRKNCHIGGMNGDLIAIDKICSDVIAYDPIPLTEEILKANGWKITKGNPLQGTMTQGYLNNISFVYFFDDGIEFEIGTHMRVRGVMKYVHELQHALRICGLDDLADNFKVK